MPKKKKEKDLQITLRGWEVANRKEKWAMTYITQPTATLSHNLILQSGATSHYKAQEKQMFAFWPH